jgi:hypothetical protein
VATSEEIHETLLSIREVVASYAIYWHKLAVDSTIFITTGSIALAGFSLSRPDASRPMLISSAIILFLLCWMGAYLVRLVESKTMQHQTILARLDKFQRLFERSAYIPDESVYPPEWSDTGARKSDPIFKFCSIMLWVLPIVLASLIIVTGWH